MSHILAKIVEESDAEKIGIKGLTAAKTNQILVNTIGVGIFLAPGSLLASRSDEKRDLHSDESNTILANCNHTTSDGDEHLTMKQKLTRAGEWLPQPPTPTDETKCRCAGRDQRVSDKDA